MSLHLKERRGRQERLRKKLLRASSTIQLAHKHTQRERENVLIDSFLDLLILKNSWPFAQRTPTRTQGFPATHPSTYPVIQRPKQFNSSLNDSLSISVLRFILSPIFDTVRRSRAHSFSPSFFLFSFSSQRGGSEWTPYFFFFLPSACSIQLKLAFDAREEHEPFNQANETTGSSSSLSSADRF